MHKCKKIIKLKLKNEVYAMIFSQFNFQFVIEFVQQ